MRTNRPTPGMTAPGRFAQDICSRINRSAAIGTNGMSGDAIRMLRAIRDRMDNEGFYGGTIEEAAGLAGVTKAETQRALRELSRRGFAKSHAQSRTVR